MDLTTILWTTWAVACFSTAVLVGLLMLHAFRSIPRLADMPLPPADFPLPKISLIAPARNEERNIEAAMRSLLKIDYPNLEITIVNDRSEDSTGRILDRLAASEPRLNVVHIDQLPPGWLGKNHANQFGADHASGDWLLFTDADVIFEPTAVKRGIYFAILNNLDHLAVAPDCQMQPVLLRAYIIAFMVLFTLHLKTWRVKQPRDPAHVGIGAFNLIRKAVYHGIGGHRPIKLRPDDDLKLGKLVKLHGFNQFIASGRGMIVVEWYPSVWEMFRGMEKNMFSGVDYRPELVVFSLLALITGQLLPFVAWIFTPAPACWLFAATAIIYFLLALRSAWELRQPLYIGLLYPVAIILFIIAMSRATMMNLWQGGLQWRGTFYSLEELRKNVV
jgi:glycosyltransferase involved in cell wall biosynthesis